MFDKFRADWKAAGEALDRNEKTRQRRAARTTANTPTPDEVVAIINTATIAGNDANSALNN